MFNPNVIANGVRADFADPAIAAFAAGAPRVAYGTAGFRTIGTALPPIAYRCAFVVFCRALSVRMAIPTAQPFDAHRFLINPATIGDCGMMITASHNPAKDNGLKMVDPDAGMFVMDWEADATDVANVADADAFGAAVTAFAKQFLLIGGNGADNSSSALLEAPLHKLLRERPVRVHIGRDTRSTGGAILSSLLAAVAAINATFAPIVFGAEAVADGTKKNKHIVLEVVDHGIVTTPILHAMVYWNRHHHELPLAELGLDAFTADGSNEATTTEAVPTELELLSKVANSHGALLNATYAAVPPANEAASRKSMAVALSTPITKRLNERLVFRAFVFLWEAFDLRRTAAKGPRTVVVDCSNGVGAVVLKESLDLPLALLPEDRAFLALASSSPSAPTPFESESSVTIGRLVAAVTGIEFSLVHDNTADPTVLNKDCGADHTQKTRVPSPLFAESLAAFVAKNGARIVAEMAKEKKDNSSSSSIVHRFCAALSSLIAFYCFDGDADRVVAFVACPSEAEEKKAGASDEAVTEADLPALVGRTTFALLDGDRIAVLMASIVRDALKRGAASSLASSSAASTPSSAASSSHSHGHGHHRDPQVGVVQTAYANGASTNFITSKLHIPVVCAATGVKYLHPKAEAMEVGVYFEANGHGTALSHPSLFAAGVKLPGEEEEGSSDHLRHPNRAIAPYAWFGASASNPAARSGLHLLLLLRLLLSQCCGDALADMLACELALAALGWSALHWLTMYSDLPSITGKTTVADPSVIKNTPDQREATAPTGLQQRINAIVEAVGGEAVLARSFVRPSGTEPIVRVYAEATTSEITDALFEKVAAAVREMCH